jgi:hypothetical protein
MRTSNYDITRDKMEKKFLEYDQSRMIKKFALEYDDDYIYITFISRLYRVGRKTGRAEWTEDGFKTAVHGGFNDSMTIFDVLCCSEDDCRLSGRFTSVNMLKGTAQTQHLGEGLNQSIADSFSGHMEELKNALLSLGGRQNALRTSADVDFTVYAFPFLPLEFRFWDADDEFPASMSILMDENILSYMHYETTYYMVGHLLDRITELMDK